MSERSNPELATKLVGESKLTVVSPHLRYRVDRVRLPNGAEVDYTFVDDDYAASAVVPLDRKNGHRSVFLVRQERYPSQSIGWEIPAGRPEKIKTATEERVETAWEAAIRELAEEAGLVAEHWHQLPQQNENIGRGNSRSDLFIAAGLTAVRAQPDVSEVITDRQWFPMYEVEDMMLDGRINTSHTLASLALANTFVNRNPDHPISLLVS